jgi:hypothetical protein
MWACYRRSLEMGGQHSNVGPGRMMPAPEVSTEVVHRHLYGELPKGEMRKDSDEDGHVAA